jgi:hypothetical protein
MLNEAQLQSRKLAQDIFDNVKKCKSEGYNLTFENKNYSLPQKGFSTTVFGYHYGLKLLPDTVKKYIEEKDFLDVGALIGDASIMFLQYKPRNIFAYEPVTESYKTSSQNYRNVQK